MLVLRPNLMMDCCTPIIMTGIIAINNDRSILTWSRTYRFMASRFLFSYPDLVRPTYLWAQVLVSDNLHHRQLIDQVGRYYLFLARSNGLSRLSLPPCLNAQIQTMSRLPSRLSYPPISLLS